LVATVLPYKFYRTPQEEAVTPTVLANLGFDEMAATQDDNAAISVGLL